MITDCVGITSYNPPGILCLCVISYHQWNLGWLLLIKKKSLLCTVLTNFKTFTFTSNYKTWIMQFNLLCLSSIVVSLDGLYFHIILLLHKYVFVIHPFYSHLFFTVLVLYIYFFSFLFLLSIWLVPFEVELKLSFNMSQLLM